MVLQRTCVIDIETDSLSPTKIHCLVVLDADTGKIRTFESGAGKHAEVHILSFDRVVAHNGCSFDFPALKKLWNIDIPFERQWDTLVLSRLSIPDRDGGHSLEAWGQRLGSPKLDFAGPWETYTPEMLEYCSNDAFICAKLFQHLRQEMAQFELDAIRDEHRVQILADKVKAYGFLFDLDNALELYGTLRKEEEEITAELQEVFPPKELQLKTKTKYIPFNPASRQQIAQRLMELGWVPKEFTESGTQAKIDENILEDCDIPEAKALARYFVLLKRTGLIDSWVSACQEDHRVRATYHTLGAVTNRMSCSKPNLQQVPSARKPFGLECRALWKCAEGSVLIDSDAKGLELRVLAHYMDDADYTKELLTGDIHTTNQAMAGLDTRDQAKTFIYALLYGAGDAKIGSVVGGNESDGAALRSRFLDNLPSYARFQRAVVEKARKQKVLFAIDGRVLRVRSPHAAVNTLIQGSSAVLMKKWFLYTDHFIEHFETGAGIVAMIHDEIVIESPKSQVENVSSCVKLALDHVVGKYQLRCRLDCDVKTGNNWSEIH